MGNTFQCIATFLGGNVCPLYRLLAQILEYRLRRQDGLRDRCFPQWQLMLRHLFGPYTDGIKYIQQTLSVSQRYDWRDNGNVQYGTVFGRYYPDRYLKQPSADLNEMASNVRDPVFEPKPSYHAAQTLMRLVNGMLRMYVYHHLSCY